MKIGRKELERKLKDYDPSLKLGKILGEGATSLVYELPGTNPPQVLKVMDTRCRPDAEGDDRISVRVRRQMKGYFRNEISAMKELRDCRYIVTIMDSYECPLSTDPSPDQSGKSVFFVRMRRLMSLENFIKKYGMTEKLVVQMAMDVCRALQECENHGILHRDVKPANIFVSKRKGRLCFVLGDFGVCRRLDKLSDSFVTNCGTLPFRAPEIELKKKIHGVFNADIFSLGSTLYYLLSGGAFPKFFFDKGVDAPPGIPSVSRELEKIILKAVQFYPENRYIHAEEMLQALKEVVPDSEKGVIENPYFIGAKQALMQGNIDKAIKLAHIGSSRNEPGCRRLQAFCLYSKYGSDPQVAEQVKQALDVLIYEGDPIAQYIRATLHNRDHELEEYVYNLRESAEAGCCISKYVYGRHLYFGDKGIEKDPGRGVDMIVQAAEEGYLPALRFLGKYGVIKSERLRSMMKDGDTDYNSPQKEKEAILKFL